jgi:hypothetical protein
MVVGALALALMIGGGTYAGLEGFNSSPKATPTATSPIVRDLQSLDENSQLFQQMDMLDQPDNGADTGSR